MSTSFPLRLFLNTFSLTTSTSCILHSNWFSPLPDNRDNRQWYHKGFDIASRPAHLRTLHVSDIVSFNSFLRSAEDETAPTLYAANLHSNLSSIMAPPLSPSQPALLNYFSSCLRRNKVRPLGAWNTLQIRYDFRHVWPIQP